MGLSSGGRHQHVCVCGQHWSATPAAILSLCGLCAFLLNVSREVRQGRGRHLALALWVRSRGGVCAA